MRRLLCALLLLAAPAAAGRYGAESREFFSPGGAFRLKVDYEGAGGGGGVRAELYGSSGKRISSFEAPRAPFSVTVSADGRRLLFFCGSWGHSVSIDSLEVRSGAGELLAKHKLGMEGTAGEAFSSDGSFYAVGAERGDSRSVLLLDARTGRRLWSRKFPERITGLRLAPDGRLLAVLAGEGDARAAAVFDRSGRELGRAEIRTPNGLTPRVFSAGGEFELWEDRTVYNAKDGYWHAVVVRKRAYRVTEEGIEELSSSAADEEFRP